MNKPDSTKGSAARGRITTWGRTARLPLAAIAGVLIGLAIAPPVSGDVGPFTMSATVRPALDPGTRIQLAPLGAIALETHQGPLAFDMRLEELQADEARAIAENPDSLADLEDGLAGDARALLVSASIRAALAGALGGLLAAFLARRSLRGLAFGAVVTGLVIGSSGAVVAASFDPDAVGEPRYSGLLALAPTAVGDVEDLVDRFGEYRAQLTGLVANAVTLYRAGQRLPDLNPGREVVRILHVSDIHNNPQAFDLIEQLVEDFSINAVMDTGDISDWGSGAETRLSEPIGDLGIPYVFVRGNHDSTQTEAAIAAQPNAVVLDGESSQVAGLTVWGIGDPRFTPDKSGETGVDVEREAIAEFAPGLRRELVRHGTEEVDLVMVHDRRAATEIDGLVPLVLTGHYHQRKTEQREGTLILTEGSTGGAGLRALQGEFPAPLSCSILYFDREEQRLVAYDRVTVSGFGGSGASIEREIVPRPTRGEGEGEEGSGPAQDSEAADR